MAKGTKGFKAYKGEKQKRAHIRRQGEAGKAGEKKNPAGQGEGGRSLFSGQGEGGRSLFSGQGQGQGEGESSVPEFENAIREIAAAEPDLEELSEKLPHFQEIGYDRPDAQEFKDGLKELSSAIKNSREKEQILAILNEALYLAENFIAAKSLIDIRYRLNANDPFYKGEAAYFAEVWPEIQDAMRIFRKDIEAYVNFSKLPDYYFEIFYKPADFSRSGFLSDKALSDTALASERRENALVNNYVAAISSVAKTLSIDGTGYLLKTDKIGREIDQIASDLVKERNKPARMLGYNNFVALAHRRLKRQSYERDDYRRFHRFVEYSLLPLLRSLEKIPEAPAISLKRSEIKKLLPQVIAASESKAQAMPYCAKGKISAGEFLRLNFDKAYCSYETGRHKLPMNFVKFLPLQKMPFIAGDIRGIAGLADFLHKVSQAYMAYLNKDWPPVSHVSMSIETLSIWESAIEFAAIDYSPLFDFEEEEERPITLFEDQSAFSHYLRACYLAYLAATGIFQEELYNNEPSPEETAEIRQKIASKYLPFLKQRSDYFKEGKILPITAEIFLSPFALSDKAAAILINRQLHGKYGPGLIFHEEAAIFSQPDVLYADFVKHFSLADPFSEEALDFFLKECEEGLKDYRS